MTTRPIRFDDDDEMTAIRAEALAADDMGAAELGADYHPAGEVHRAPLTPAFVTAGKAIFTVSNPQGVRYTFRVKLPKEPRGEFFASVLYGPQNESDYVYVGMVDGKTGTLRTTRGSKVAADDVRTKVLAFALRVIYGRQVLPRRLQDSACGQVRPLRPDADGAGEHSERVRPGVPDAREGGVRWRR